MSHSLRAKLSGLHYKGILEDKDYKRLCKALDNENVLEQIRDEIQKVINAERDFTSKTARAQAIALNWCLDIIDKYTKEPEK